MLADFYTKPLQGNLFNVFRRVIMGYESINSILDHTNTFFEERVGGNSTNCPKIEAKIVHDNKNENIRKSDVQTYTEEQNIDNDVCK